MAIKAGYPQKSEEQRQKDREDLEYNRSSIKVGDDSVLITFLDQGMKTTEEVKDPNTGEVKLVETTIPVSVVIKKEDLPAAPTMPRNGLKIKECMVMYNRKQQKVLAIGPYYGTFVARAVQLGPRQRDTDIPVARSKPSTGQDGKMYNKVEFWCAYEITKDLDNGGLFVGAKPRLWMHYKFYDQDGVVGVMGNMAKAPRTKQLFDWGQAQGIFDEDLPWPVDGNVLPLLDERIRLNPTEIELKVEKGFVKEVRQLHSASGSVLDGDADLSDELVKVEEVQPKTEETTASAENDSLFGDA